MTPRETLPVLESLGFVREKIGESEVDYRHPSGLVARVGAVISGRARISIIERVEGQAMIARTIYPRSGHDIMYIVGEWLQILEVTI